MKAGFGLAVLSLINLFNYLDRYVVPALFESLKHSALRLSDENLGALMSVFLLIYTLSAPVFGALGDRRSRPKLIAAGVALWSLATALSGFVG
ncbi:MAG: MFS transporter, partial [Gammaproteobacteria bacterium]|nr:MFS transporter [Gammaproteobacteria bacterium]